MSRYKTLSIVTEYWKPGQDYIEKIIKSVKGKISANDIIVISEKAISTTLSNIADESCIKPSSNARFIARIWMRIVWGYLLGPLCHFQRKLLEQIREYPMEIGARHKQIALQQAGLLQALMFGSEGGIDGSNLAFSYVSLPLEHSYRLVKGVYTQIMLQLKKKTTIMIVDTDKTYSWRNFHFTPRPNPIKGIHSSGGFWTYVLGRMLSLKRRATPLAIIGSSLTVEEALEIAELANRARGSGAGKTVWDMADKFKVGLTAVTWEMLDRIKHKPIVIIRRKR